jgi:hypothetical protein
MRFFCAALLFLAAACSDANVCDTRTDDVGDLCIPATISPDIPSVVEVRELCAPACSGAPSCTALFVNGQVVLDITQDVCSDSLGSTCLALGCRQRAMTCVLPALPAGQYRLSAPGGSARLLRVGNGGASSCRFPTADGGVQ